MEKKEFEKIVKKRRAELESKDRSSNLYSVGFSNGMLEAYKLLSKEEITISGQTPEININYLKQRIREIDLRTMKVDEILNDAGLKVIELTKAVEALEKLSNKAKE